jgi:hypothetical protein
MVEKPEEIHRLPQEKQGPAFDQLGKREDQALTLCEHTEKGSISCALSVAPWSPPPSRYR